LYFFGAALPGRPPAPSKKLSGTPTGTGLRAWGENELRNDQICREAGLLALAPALDLDLDHDRALADVQGLGDGDDLVSEQTGREDVELQLDRREVVFPGDVAEGRPSGDGVAQRRPDAAVDVTARVQVTTVDDDPAFGEIVLDPQRLDRKVTGKLPGRKARTFSGVNGERSSLAGTSLIAARPYLRTAGSAVTGAPLSS
jgi:hypothetical protein